MSVHRPYLFPSPVQYTKTPFFFRNWFNYWAGPPSKGHGTTFVCPVSRKVSKLAAILFVDDTDIIHMRMDLKESADGVHLAI